MRVGLQRKLSTFWTVVLEKTLESPLDCKKMEPVHPKGNQSWIVIGRTDVKIETPILCPPDAKKWLICKDPDAGKDWRWEENGTTENEMAEWHHRLDGHEFEQALGVGDGQGILVCCSPWGLKELDRNEQLNWTESLADISRWLTHRFASGSEVKSLFLLGLLQKVNLGLINIYISIDSQQQ